MKSQKKTYDLTYENIEKIKQLNDQYLSYYQNIEKSLFKKSKDSVKTNILISDLLDEMLKHQNDVNDPAKLFGQKTQLFVDRIDKRIHYKERIEAMKNNDKQHYMMAGLWITMCGYIVLLFVKEMLSHHYLIHFYIDSLVAVIALFVTINNIKNEIKLIKRYQLSFKPIVVEIVGFVVALLIAIFMYQSPFDITFVILVVALFTNKKIFEKEMDK